MWDNENDLCKKNLLFHHFINDMSHNIWLYFVIAKGEKIEKLKNFKVHIEKINKIQNQDFYSYVNGKFMSKIFSDFLKGTWNCKININTLHSRSKWSCVVCKLNNLEDLTKKHVACLKFEFGI